MLRQGTAVCSAIALVVACATVAPAGAAPPPKNLWATVNICDTANHPNQMGVRASMPGDGRRERMFMRFHTQFYNPANKRWFRVKGSGSSGWLFAGSARFRARQAGYTFSFAPPKDGTAFVLRGVVDFQWRVRRRTHTGHRRWVVVREQHANTKGEHPSMGADPAGYSSGTCEIRSP